MLPCSLLLGHSRDRQNKRKSGRPSSSGRSRRRCLAVPMRDLADVTRLRNPMIRRIPSSMLDSLIRSLLFHSRTSWRRIPVMTLSFGRALHQQSSRDYLSSDLREFFRAAMLPWRLLNQVPFGVFLFQNRESNDESRSETIRRFYSHLAIFPRTARTLFSKSLEDG